MIDNETALGIFYICLAFGGAWLALLGLARLGRGHAPTHWLDNDYDQRVAQEWLDEYQIKDHDLTYEDIGKLIEAGEPTEIKTEDEHE